MSTTHVARAWFHADVACRNMRSRLVKIRSETEFHKLLALSPVAEFYVGLRRSSGESPWKWADGSLMQTDSFVSRTIKNEASKYNPSCVYARKGPKDLYNYPCTTLKAYACEYRPDEPVPLFPAYLAAPRTWENGVSLCQGMGGTLPMLKTELIAQGYQDGGENNQHYWLGIHDMDGDGIMEYVDGNHLGDKDYTNWAEGQIINEEAPNRCAYVNVTDNQWYISRACTSTKYWTYCEMDARCHG